MNIVIPPNTFVDIYDETGFTVGTQLSFVNVSNSSIRLFDTATEPTQADNQFPVVWGNIVYNETGDLGSWAFAATGGTLEVRVA